MEQERPEKIPNADQLRTAIDSGAANDKVAFRDPAAAPLGTDAEAAGASPASRELRQAFNAEVTGKPPRRRNLKAGVLAVLLGFLGLILVSTFITALIFA